MVRDWFVLIPGYFRADLLNELGQAAIELKTSDDLARQVRLEDRSITSASLDL